MSRASAKACPWSSGPIRNSRRSWASPLIAPDGRSIYFSRNTTPGNIFEYAQDSNQQVFAIERYDMATAERTQVAGGPGGAVRPTPSPDGRWLAYVHRTGGRSRLFVKDLRSGEERQVYADLDQDLQETWAVHGVYPNMDWTPDSNAIVFWAGGKLRRVNRDGGDAAEIPFQVSDTRVVIDPPRPQIEVAPANVTTRMPRFAAVSPDGSRVVYETLGRLYVRRSGRRRAAPADRAGRRLPALAGLVARRPDRSPSSRGTTSASAKSAPSRPTDRTCARSPSSPAITGGRASRPTAAPSSSSLPAAAA